MLKMFSVYDSKTEAFLQPFYALATGAAVRMFESAAADREHHFHKHAADFTLFEIGAFNEDTGQLTALLSHINLGNALTFYSHHTTDGRAVEEMSKQHPDYEKTKAEIRNDQAELLTPIHPEVTS